MGVKAADLNQLALGIAAKHANGERSDDAELLPALGELRTRMAEVATGAKSLNAAAREADFEDIARQADSLRQQIMAADDKVAAIEKSLAERADRLRRASGDSQEDGNTGSWSEDADWAE